MFAGLGRADLVAVELFLKKMAIPVTPYVKLTLGILMGIGIVVCLSKIFENNAYIELLLRN